MIADPRKFAIASTLARRLRRGDRAARDRRGNDAFGVPDAQAFVEVASSHQGRGIGATLSRDRLQLTPSSRLDGLVKRGEIAQFSVVMARRLFTVVIQTEIIVLAGDETHAEIVAKHIVEDEWPARDLRESSFKFQAQPMSHLPVGWDENEFPEDNTLEEPERTIRELIERGAAPRMCS